MQTAVHDPMAETTVTAREFAEARRKRLARIEARAYRVPVVPVPPQKIEIVEADPGDTTIEVTACNGQIVIVTERQIAEARAVFERVRTFGAKVSVEQIQRAVCEKFNVTRLDMLSMRRTKDLVIPRQVAMYLSKTMTFKSLPEIGRRFNGKDHTTVLHAVRKMSHLVQNDETIRGVIAELQAELGGEQD